MSETKNEVNVMLDLETLGTAPGCVIVSIGAVFFNPEAGTVNDMNTFYRSLDIDSCLRTGLTVDGGTLKWWMAQSDQVRGEVKSTEGPGLSEVLHDFYAWVLGHHSSPTVKQVLMWGKGPAFDCAILRAAYEKANCSRWLPWEPDRGNRCHRTLVKMFPEIPEPDRGGNTAHNALGDAIHQARHNVAIHQYLKARLKDWREASASRGIIQTPASHAL